jgi:GWxTD domain-containing protein
MQRLIFLLFAGLVLSTSAGVTQKKKSDKLDYYRKWLDEDVVYIISEEEKAVFQKLTTGDERDQFIEQFWVRRDTDPSTPENEFKEEHYRRVQYANDRFAAGIPGWRTDRGRVYIQFGKPDRLESHPAGGPYQRKAHEGGGQTSTYPFEVWEYRHIDGIGDDIELEFVNDTGGANLFRLTMDAQDKDELLHVPGMGLTDAEMFDPNFNGQKSWERVNRVRESGLARNQGINFERAKDQPFEKSLLLAKISAPPLIRFNDLKEKVTTRVTFNVLPFKVVSHFVRVDSENCIVPVTLSFDPQDISFKTEAGIYRSQLQVYGLVTTLTNRTVYEFDDDIVAEYSSGQIDAMKQLPQMYQRKLALKPGKYKLDLIVKDTVSSKMGTTAVGLEIPSAPSSHLSTSSIMLTHNIQPAEADWSSPYVFGIYRVRPEVTRTFSNGDDFGFYVEGYNYQLDQTTQKPALQIRYGFAAPGKEPANYRLITGGVTMAEDRVYLARMVQLNGLEKGKHDLVFVLTDTLSGESTVARAPFEIR